MRRFALRAAGCLAGLCAFLLAPLTLAAQNPPQDPTLHVSTHLVQIGVVVRDKNGPVKDLTKDDFVILDRGKPQTIGVFSAESGGTGEAPSASPLPPNTFSDQARNGATESGSVTIVLLDNLNTLFGSDPQPYEKTPYWLEDHALAAAKQRLMEFLKQMRPGDRIAIYGLTERLRVLCDFTCDRDQLLAVVGKYDATSTTARDAAEPSVTQTQEMPDFSYDDAATVDTQALADINNERRGEITMSALTAIAAHVADLPGRKNLLWLTANLPFSGEAIARVLARGNIAAYPVDARGLLPGAPVISMNEVDGDAYAEGKAGRPLGHTTIPVGIDTMVDMAADTGGHAFVNNNDLVGAIRAVVEDAGVTYTLGFYLPNGEVDGKFHKLTVQVRRPELTLAYPRGYFAYKDTAASENESHNSFLAAIRSPLDAAAVPLQVKLDRVDQPQPHSIQIVGVVGIENIHLPKDGAMRQGAVDVYTIQQDAAGNVLHQANQRLNLKLTEPQYQTYLQSGILFREVLQPEHGATVLRVLVQDPGTSEVGSVIIPLARVR